MVSAKTKTLIHSINPLLEIAISEAKLGVLKQIITSLSNANESTTTNVATRT